MITLKELIQSETADAFEKKALAIAAALELPIASWHLGSVIRTIVRLVCELLAPLTELQVEVVKAGFLDLATGIWLDALAFEVYDVTRVPATFAAGSVTLSNSAGGSHTYAARTFNVFSPSTNKVYTNSASFTLAPLQVGLVVPVEAIEVGAASSASIGTVTALQTPLIGVSVANPQPIVGLEAESDASVRLRCRLSTAAVSPNGPADAYRYVALTPSLNGNVVCTRATLTPPSSTGSATLLVAGPNGALTGGEVSAIQTAINKLCVPTGFSVLVVSASGRPMAVTSTVYVYSALGIVSAELQAAIQTRLANYVAGLPIGADYTTPGDGNVFANTLESEIRASTTPGATGAQIHRVTLTVPAADLPIASTEVVTLSTVTTTVVQVT